MVATFFGVIFNLVGILLLFRYGLPQIALPGQPGAKMPERETIDEMNVRRSGEIGLLLLLLGTLLQAVGAFAA
ncbi:hypothetical protein [Afifella sp. IM 167]|uniref:hypothetical protein n=1 Tax=Afifella sp. IM 167 TaxID=2033586 RepID=UPI001CCE569B|nr:hypothetical protein [Afifella sp. IM 167]MBZ8132692.1 hypothetical protein [Afifella sp. IM 167]